MDIYSELLKHFSEQELEEKINKKIDSFHGLLTREVAMKLIAKEGGFFKEDRKFYKIKEIPKEAKKVSLVAKVEKIFSEVSYPSGKRSRSVLLKDETGEINLKLWENDISICAKLRTSAEVKLIDAYEKFGDLNLGYSGSLEVLSGNSFTPLDSLKDGARVHVYAEVSNISGEKSDRFEFVISDTKNSATVLLEHGKERGKRLEVGDLVILDNSKVSEGALLVDSSARLLLKKRKGLVSGKLENLETDAETLSIRISGKDFSLDRANALKILNAEAPEDISLSTVVSLKKEEMLGKPISFRVKETNGTFIILE